jgi:hypothetical protein
MGGASFVYILICTIVFFFPTALSIALQARLPGQIIAPLFHIISTNTALSSAMNNPTEKGDPMKTAATRRDFMKRSLKYGAAVTAGAVGVLSGMTALSPQKLFATTPKTEQWPWPHAKLDPDKVMKRAYEGYSKGG